MKARIVLIILGMTAVMGCSENKYEHYIGYWQKLNTSSPRVIKIHSSNDLFFLNRRALIDRSNNASQSGDFVLSAKNGKLIFESDISPMTLQLSSDKKTLHIANEHYRLITEIELEKLAVEKKKKNDDSKNCMLLRDEYQSAINDINSVYLPREQRNTQESTLFTAFTEKAKRYTGCVIYKGF